MQNFADEYVPVEASGDTIAALDIIYYLRGDSILRYQNIIINTITNEVYQITQRGIIRVDRVDRAELPTDFFPANYAPAPIPAPIYTIPAVCEITGFEIHEDSDPKQPHWWRLQG